MQNLLQIINVINLAEDNIRKRMEECVANKIEISGQLNRGITEGAEPDIETGESPHNILLLIYGIV